jgi:hypothetical protein
MKIELMKDAVEEKIKWYDVIANAINENINTFSSS